ncbi:MAG TPA: lactate utilization protein [Alphaproteobacteria bacterium]|jgi:L-lactate utilization protein LutB|nr:lactate utilization protein [Alphaproteobacteria bacterium]
MDFNNLPTQETIDQTIKSLQDKGYNVIVTENGAEALEKIKTLIPQGASVMNGASITLETIGYTELLKSGNHNWNDLHANIVEENDPEKRKQLRKESVLSDYYLGSVHAVTQDGQMIIASNTGSQLPHVVFTSPNLIFVIGTQKIVPNLDEAMKRLEEYVFPLEDKHMQTLYKQGSNISKLLIFKSESPMMGRKINIILVKEKLGF